MKVAIYSRDFNWAGGVDFLHFLVKGLLSQSRRKVEIFILIFDPSIVQKRGFYKQLKRYTKAGVNIVLKPVRLKTVLSFKKRNLQSQQRDYDQINNIKEIFSSEKVTIVYYNDNIDEALKTIGVDIILPVLGNRFPSNYPIPWIGYLFDFVYKYHTHLYTKDFCLQTDINFATTLLNAKSAIVNSKATFNDLYKYFPYSKAKVFSLPFAPYTNEHIYKIAAACHTIKDKYKIDQPYFIISNQFWLHKSHETAFRALSLLRENERYKDIKLVCTGLMTDLSGTESRKIELLGEVSTLGLQNSIYFVGHIPKVDQLALMLRCIAVLQPTLFEGGPGGGAVYMAIANGIPAIVSNIAVNQEITDEPLVTFFETANHKDLSTKMTTAITADREIVPYEILCERNKNRLSLLGNTLIDCIEDTINAGVIKK